MEQLKDSENPFEIYGEFPKRKLYDGYEISSVYIPMRDGVKIAANISIPKGLSENARLPTLLYQTRYWRALNLRLPFRWIFNEHVGAIPIHELFTSRGYVVVYIDVRGTGASYGSRAFPWTEVEVKDGADIVDWIISQPWSNGKVVSNGISYSGSCAEKLAFNAHPAVKAIMPGHCFWDAYTDVALPGGCYNLQFMQMWSFLGRNLDQNNPKVMRTIMPINWIVMKGIKPVDGDNESKMLYETIKEHSANLYVHELVQDKDYRNNLLSDGTAIDDVSNFPKKDKIEASNVPIIHWCSWLDSGYVDAIIHRFLNLKNPQIGILGDWNHGARFPANQFYPERAKVNPTPRERINAWINLFNSCTEGKGIEGKTLFYYTMAEEKWKSTHIWPPEGHHYERWYFKESNGLSMEKPQDKNGFDKYKINFRTTTGRNNRWWTLLGLPISYSNREKIDEKLLTYTSTPLKNDFEITGHAIITLYLSSTHEDGAIYAYLEDVDENGKVTYITDGQLRMIHRELSSEPPLYDSPIPYRSYKRESAKPMNPGEISEMKFALHATSVLIQKGHKIRIAFAGNDKDTFSRYPKEGKPTIKIVRNPEHPSFIDLPKIKRKDER